MNNEQELKAHLQDRNKARIYAEKKNRHNVLVANEHKKKIEDDIWEIENQYPYLHFDKDRHKFNKSDVNELNKLYSKLKKIEHKKKEDAMIKNWKDEIAINKGGQ